MAGPSHDHLIADGPPPDHHILDEPIGPLIRRVRRQRGLSQSDLAAALAKASGNQSVAREHIARWERGAHTPSRYWRGFLCRELAVSRHQLERAVIVAKRKVLEGINFFDP